MGKAKHIRKRKMKNKRPWGVSKEDYIGYAKSQETK